MMEFKQQLKRRIYLGGIYCVVVALLVILSRIFDAENMAFAFSLGFAIGIEFVAFYFIAKYRAALRDEKNSSSYISRKMTKGKNISVIKSAGQGL